MQNPELAEIDASLQAIVRRAYDLGRSDALKKVVDALSEDRPVDQLALMAPNEAVPAPHHNAENYETPSVKMPWWVWPVR